MKERHYQILALITTLIETNWRRNETFHPFLMKKIEPMM